MIVTGMETLGPGRVEYEVELHPEEVLRGVEETNLSSEALRETFRIVVDETHGLTEYTVWKQPAIFYAADLLLANLAFEKRKAAAETAKQAKKVKKAKRRKGRGRS